MLPARIAEPWGSRGMWRRDRARRGRLIWPVASLPYLLDCLAHGLEGLPSVVLADGPALPRVREAAAWRGRPCGGAALNRRAGHT